MATQSLRDVHGEFIHLEALVGDAARAARVASMMIPDEIDASISGEDLDDLRWAAGVARDLTKRAGDQFQVAWEAERRARAPDGDGDAELASLFSRWIDARLEIAARGKISDGELDEACKLPCSLEKQMADIRACTLAGMAIKAFMTVWAPEVRGGADGAADGADSILRIPTDQPDRIDHEFMFQKSLLGDVLRFLPDARAIAAQQ